MTLIITYDAAGNITGRISMSDGTQVVNYPNNIEIDGEDYAAVPEDWAEIDLNKKSLRPKPGRVDPTSKGRTRN